MELPAGFRFHPTDEELITHYLNHKVIDSNFQAIAIGEADLNKCEPWDLPRKAKMGEKEWYFFCVRDRKYPIGLRANRATEAGYYKATGKDREVLRGRVVVGMKKTLVFYKGRAPRGQKTNWVMHEYRLENHNTLLKVKSEWVVCRIYEKTPCRCTTPVAPLMTEEDTNKTTSLIYDAYEDSTFATLCEDSMNGENMKMEMVMMESSNKESPAGGIGTEVLDVFQDASVDLECYMWDY